MVRWTLIRRFALVALAAGITACSEPATAPEIQAAAPNLIGSETGPSLLQCRRTLFDVTWGLIGPLGGVLSLNGNTITVPPLALNQLAFITIRQPSTPFVEVEVRVNGRDHFQFDAPLTVAIDYSRCADWRIGPEPLTVWQIDPDTKAFIADMGGVDDRAARKISFTTDHFSGYAIAQ